MNHAQPRDLVLSIYPFTRGFSFVFFEGSESPFDWGVKEVRRKQKNTKTLDEIRKLIDRYRPEVLVIEDVSDKKKSRRNARIRKLYRMLAHVALIEYVDLCRITRAQIKECFATVGATTKFEIAKAIAGQIPAFRHRIPPLRKPWVSEDPRQSLFDAAALRLTYFARNIRSSYADDVSP